MAKKIKLKNGYYIIEEIKNKENLLINIEIVGEEVSFFRFRGVNEHSKKAFLNDEMSFSKPITFNDPYDTYLTFDKIKVMDKIAEIQGATHQELITNKDYYDFVHQIMIDTIKKTSYVACFSEIVDNPAMWAHYSNQGKGFVLEYKYKDILDTGKFLVEDWINRLLVDNDISIDEVNEKGYDRFIDLHHSFYPMRYTNRSNDFTNELIKEIELQRSYNFENKEDIKKIFDLQLDEESYKMNNSMRTSLTTIKNSYWRYEREWRLSASSFDFFDDHNFVYPVVPTAIYLGEFMSFADKFYFCTIAKAKGITVYQMFTKHTVKTNKLVFKKLNDKEIDEITKI